MVYWAMENWTPMNSQAISGIGYDPSNRVLRVAFRSGSIYDYFGANPALVRSLIHAPSQGAFFATNIRDKLQFQRIR